MKINNDFDKARFVKAMLDLETHAKFRSVLALYNVSMQEAFEALARMVGSGSHSGQVFVRRIVKRRLKARMAADGIKPLKGMKFGPRAIGEQDFDALYDLIEEGDDDEAT